MQEPGSRGTDTREKLIRAGVDELNEYGLADFSTRRVAAKCGVSCATPYKHFESTKAFIIEILRYINDNYAVEEKRVLEQYADADDRTKLLQLSLSYIEFLVRNPEFRNIITQNFVQTEPEYRTLREQLSVEIYKVALRCCKSLGVSDDVRQRKIFLIRSIVYGAALFFGTQQMAVTPENMEMVRSVLDQELRP